LSVPKFIVYVELETPLDVQLYRKPTAFTVVVVPTVSGELYAVEDDVGVEPSSVYRMVTPGDEVDIETVWAEVYVPAAGLSMIDATVSV
jgi:hypothetical protein